ncbi:TPA: hypothetical protein QDZ42_001816 [Stenotrophomonas maltophilia]|nr:hypothetical protein [Stenotrophomonas maltophilia]HDS1043165.1 hypothetical protein [Stenotrophomonas maltophilia]
MKAYQFTRPIAVLMFIPMIGLGSWGSWFGSYCLSDGCLGVFVAWVAAVAVFILQALLVLPLHAWALKRHVAKVSRSYVQWLGASALAMLLPILAGWGYMMMFG